MGDIFGGVDLEDLASGNLTSESVIIEDLIIPNVKTEEEIVLPKEEEQGLTLEEISGLSASTKEDDDLDIIEDTKKTPEKTGESPSSQSMLNSLASALVETGVLSSLETEDIENIKDTDSLMEAIAKQIKNNELKDLTDDQRDYLEALRDGVDTAVYAEKTSNAAQYKKLSDEVIENNEKLQHELIKRDFLIKGFDEEKAKRFADLAMKEDNVAEEAIQAKNSLVAHEEGLLRSTLETEKAKRQADIDKEIKALEDLKTKVTESSDIIPGVKFNSAFKEKVFASMTTPVRVDKANPMNEVMDKYSTDKEYKLKLHALHIATKGFTDFSRLGAATKSQAVKDLKERLESTSSSSGLPLHVSTSTSQKSLASALEGLNL